ncbi:MAG: glycosyl transferase [Candidatus Altiarchaeales archaeon]|nr:MAG: glycosyl transferase [Candidatus Altiarchaeales archaeon]RLI94154.1 MAG: glycosyl transferase [Candidatus Altiarchaeales archaeon]RLI95213.1 MAG: glycosyl transferase [Candidatus Altiarchaeales archaeon]HDO82330.1 glycosyltransferase [Candidatus Altiarchaeales archaeon]HEX54979.1 glycosyltransferase [Candidatus Altiarchaeales archaeon]
MKISVIIPAYNEERAIGNCLKSIRENKYEDYDIIVVDAYSNDGTVEIAEKYADKVISVRTNSPGPARNVGVKNSNAEIVAFTDADTIVAPDWLERIADDFSNKEIVAVGGILRPKHPRLIDKIMFKINSDLWYRFTALFGFYQLPTPNCAYRRDIFLKAGGFNERLSMLEDTELSLRIKKYGRVIIDKNLWVLNSTRRFKQEGYLRIFLRYLRAYINLFLKKDINLRHFDTIRH